MLEDVPAKGGDDRHVMTRNELPDITRPLEINSADLEASPSAPIESPAPPPVTPPEAPVSRPAGSREAPSARAQPAARPADTQDANTQQQRAAAKIMFEAKFREPNPKLPFYITMALLGVFALGTVVYFWYQLRPPPALVNPNPPKPAAEAAVPAPPAPAAPAAPAPQASGNAAAPVQPAPQTTAGTAKAPASSPVEAVVPSAQTASPPSKPAAQGQTAGPQPATPGSTLAGSAQSQKSSSAQSEQPPARAATPRRSPGTSTPRPAADPSQVNVTKTALQVSPRIDAGWKAYNAGDLAAARTAYEAALREDPRNRDALLGMAAVEVQSRRMEAAEALYQRVLEADPRDPHAQAGILALRGQLVEPVQVESRVKSLLAQDPDSHVLHFTLGNQYAQQGRWPEAQQAYFKAYSSDPENPDFAYNLAVSLDQLRQPKLALEYYRRALSLTQQRSGSFDQSLARNRVQQLSR